MFKDHVWLSYIVCVSFAKIIESVTIQQFESNLAMIRSGCAPKFKLTPEEIDGIKQGIFDDNNRELKCYTRCVAQLAGVLTKKGEFSIPKAIAQIPLLIPAEMQESSKKTLEACKDTQKDYKDSCDKIYFTTKCMQADNPPAFRFP